MPESAPDVESDGFAPEPVKDLQTALFRIAALDWQEAPASEDWLEGVEEDWGAFDGLPPKVAFSDDGRTATLLAPLGYRRPDGSLWPVPAGAWLDGASIPRLFWTLIGGPFEGRYRNASIVHDHYCRVRSRPWHDVHRMFYEAMRCGGTGAAKAKIMYYAVYRFGPRWPGFEESVEEAPPGLLGDGAAASLVADAEAIHVHDLNLDAIDALADARNAAVGEMGLESVGDAELARARLLVVTGGAGTAEDLEAVARDAAHLPPFVMARFERKKIRILACRGSVTDFERTLRGVTPRGWEGTGKSWDNVPGTYFQNRKRVVIATIEEGGVRKVPTKASGLHGSDNLIIHESLHGYDYSQDHKPLRDRRFTRARDGDLASLGTYESQAGQVGLEETFAESGARFVAAPEALKQDWPNLFVYWQIGPEGAVPELPSPAEESLGLEEVADGDTPIGTAELIDGAIRLDLRAEDGAGAIGHAMLTIKAGDEAYEALRAHLAAVPAEEGAEGGAVLFRPLRNRSEKGA